VNLFAVGKVTGCFGIKGFVKVQPSTHSPGRLKKLRSVYLGRSAEDAIRYEIEDVIFNSRGILIKFASLDDRTSAENIFGQFLFVGEDERAEPEKGSYFIHEIIGCEVWTQEERFVGTLEDVYRLPAQDLWAIRSGDKVYLIPAVKEFVLKVDIKKLRITVKLIEGLLGE